MKKIFPLLVALLIMLCACSRNDKPALEGNQAPDFKVKNLTGESISLSSLRGKVVILNFWATWCPPCRGEIPSMMRLNAAMAGKPFQMLAVSIDEGGKPAVENFFQKSGMSLPTFLDSDKTIGKRYGITGVPETFVIDKSGVILKKVVGSMEWDHPEVIAFLNDAINKGKQK